MSENRKRIEFGAAARGQCADYLGGLHTWPPLVYEAGPSLCAAQSFGALRGLDIPFTHLTGPQSGTILCALPIPFCIRAEEVRR